jgi:tRNA threonylcarbamoyladenosine modification (KEOPS) complex  Pcc1 subunit
VTLITHRATLTLRTEHADVVSRALSPELTEKIPRTKVEVASEGGEVVIEIEAEDLTALRAALNSYIRWGNVAEETAEEVGKR